jgi:hypothetical protein
MYLPHENNAQNIKLFTNLLVAYANAPAATFHLQTITWEETMGHGAGYQGVAAE